MLELPRLFSLKEAAKLPREQVAASTLHEAGRERRLHVVRLGGRTDGYAGGAHSAEAKMPSSSRGIRLQFRKARGSGRKLLPRSLPKAG